jgi:hypothetical protein
MQTVKADAGAQSKNNQGLNAERLRLCMQMLEGHESLHPPL